MKKQYINNMAMFAGLAALLMCGCEWGTNPDEQDVVEIQTDWEQIGDGFEYEIYDVKSDQDGNIYIAGGEAGKISKWDGVSWSILGGGASPFSAGEYSPIEIDQSGNVYACGLGTDYPVYHVAKWDAAAELWINLTEGNPLFDNGIHDIAVDKLGNVYVSGVAYLDTTVEDGAYIYRYDGLSWTMVGSRMDWGDNVMLYVDANDNLFASYGVNDNFSPFVAQWTGSEWMELGGANSCGFGTGQFTEIGGDADGNIYACGYTVNDQGAFNLFKYFPATNVWTMLNTFYNSFFSNAIVFNDANDLFLAGEFINEEGRCYVAKYLDLTDFYNWQDHGNLYANGPVNSMCIDPLGTMYAAGMFTNDAGLYYVARNTKQ